MSDKKILKKEIKDCHSTATHLLEHLGNKNIEHVMSYHIDEIIRELEKMKNLIDQYNND